MLQVVFHIIAKEFSLIQSGGVRRDCEATATPEIGRCRPEASNRSIRGFEYMILQPSNP